MIFCENINVKKVLTLEKAKDFVFELDVIQNGCEYIVILPPDNNNADLETEDIYDLDLGEEPQNVCGELEVFVEDEESEDEEFRPKKVRTDEIKWRKKMTSFRHQSEMMMKNP